MTLRRSLVAAALAAMLAGCGHSVAPTAGLKASAIARAHSRDQAADLVAGLRALAGNINTFSAVVSFWEKKGNDVQTSTAEVYTARPGKIRANITEASSALKRGVKLVYLGDKKVIAKLGFIRKVLSYDDPQVLSAHGWRIDQTDLGAMLAGVTDPAGTATLVGPATVNGQSGVAVSVTSPTLLPGVTSEVVTLDATTFMPLRLEAYIGTDVAYRVDLAKAQLNPTLPADIFSL